MYVYDNATYINEFDRHWGNMYKTEYYLLLKRHSDLQDRLIKLKERGADERVKQRNKEAKKNNVWLAEKREAKDISPISKENDVPKRKKNALELIKSQPTKSVITSDKEIQLQELENITDEYFQAIMSFKNRFVSDIAVLLVHYSELYRYKKQNFIDRVHTFLAKIKFNGETSLYRIDTDKKILGNPARNIERYLEMEENQMWEREYKITAKFSKKNREDKFLGLVRWFVDSNGEL